jgi:hypothetical protein
MNDEVVKVACGLPHGYMLEIDPPKPGVEIPDTYLSVELTGVLKAGKLAITIPNRKGERFGLTLVRADFWAAWLAKNKTLRYVVDKSIFVVPGSAR